MEENYLWFAQPVKRFIYSKNKGLYHSLPFFLSGVVSITSLQPGLQSAFCLHNATSSADSSQLPGDTAWEKTSGKWPGCWSKPTAALLLCVQQFATQVVGTTLTSCFLLRTGGELFYMQHAQTLTSCRNSYLKHFCWHAPKFVCGVSSISIAKRVNLHFKTQWMMTFFYKLWVY